MREWRETLTPAQFRILRQAGTEHPFSSPLDREKRAGTFACAGCGLPLFSSETKFDSGTGWPSFWKPLDERRGGGVRLHARHEAGRGAVPPLRRPPRARLRGRPAAHRACATA